MTSGQPVLFASQFVFCPSYPVVVSSPHVLGLESEEPWLVVSGRRVNGLWPEAHDAPQLILRIVRLKPAIHSTVHLDLVSLSQDLSRRCCDTGTWPSGVSTQRRTSQPARAQLAHAQVRSFQLSSRPLPRRQPTSLVWSQCRHERGPNLSHQVSSRCGSLCTLGL